MDKQICWNCTHLGSCLNYGNVCSNFKEYRYHQKKKRKGVLMRKDIAKTLKIHATTVYWYTRKPERLQRLINWYYSITGKLIEYNNKKWRIVT